MNDLSIEFNGELNIEERDLLEIISLFDTDKNGVFNFDEFYDMIGPILEEEI